MRRSRMHRAVADRVSRHLQVVFERESRDGLQFLGLNVEQAAVIRIGDRIMRLTPQGWSQYTRCR